MEKPKCKLCGERHWGACAMSGGDVAQDRGPVIASPGAPADKYPYNQPPISGQPTPKIGQPLTRTAIAPLLAREAITLVMPKADSSSAAKQPKRKAKPRNPKSAAVASHQPSQLTPEEITDIKARRAEANASARAAVQAAGVIVDPRLPVRDQLAPPEKFDRIAYQREYMRKRREAVRLTGPLD